MTLKAESPATSGNPKSKIQNFPSLHPQDRYGSAGCRHAAPGLRQRGFYAWQLALTGFAAQLQNELDDSIERACFEGVAQGEGAAGNIHRRFLVRLPVGAYIVVDAQREQM